MVRVEVGSWVVQYGPELKYQDVAFAVLTL